VVLSAVSGTAIVLAIIIGIQWHYISSSVVSLLPHTPQLTCVSCHSMLTNVFSFSSQPDFDQCRYCHDDDRQGIQALLSPQNLDNQFNALAQRTFLFSLTQPTSIRRQTGFQTAINNYWGAKNLYSRLTVNASRETITQIQQLITQANDLLAALENEVESGYWVEANSQTQNSKFALAQLPLPQTPTYDRPAVIKIPLLDQNTIYLSLLTLLMQGLHLMFLKRYRGPPALFDVKSFILGILQRLLPSHEAFSVFFMTHQTLNERNRLCHADY
jgi:hypothetical protein